MEIRTALLPQLAGDVSGAVCIVIDVLRATTVIATLFDRRCPRVYVAASHDLARAFARREGYVLCGETGGVRVPDFDYGNSPVEFAALDFSERPVVLSTSNGTKAVAAVASAPRVLLGAAVNRKAVANAAWDAASELDTDIVVVCSGTDGAYTLEDATVAGLYVEALVARGGPWTMPALDDASIAARRLWQTEPNLLRGWMEGRHACHLADHGFGDDVAHCAAIDTLGRVPLLCSKDRASYLASPVILVR
ncbi:MAG TPA: 2-phosphosulfolactate phosphatase [Chthonomonadaceae bacterium]|nr:2-phosphosulfolactate phosphatase [Chthonomonadaceae bacterium]